MDGKRQGGLVPRPGNKFSDAQASCSCEVKYKATIDELSQQLEFARRSIVVLSTKIISQDLRRLDYSPCDVQETSLEQFLRPLTNREREVARLFMRFANDKSVAKELGLALQTVRNQIASIQNKLSIGSREELILVLLSTEWPDAQAARLA